MSNYVYRMFGGSPMQPLQDHMAQVHLCASELVIFFEAVIDQDSARIQAAQAAIVDFEHEADKLKKSLRLSLPKGMFLPVSRHDLLDMLTMQDNIANKSKDIAGLMLGRQMVLPESIAALFLTYVKRSIDAIAQADTAINELDELVETGFRGREVKVVQKMITTLNQIESDTDAIQIQIRAIMFKIETDLPPIDAMFIYRIIEWVGDLADLAQRVGSRLQLMLAK
ncbi:MAG: TIGR00153 family protein [Thiotrichaceae bacterium]|nr:TIGR00153 family protein [Thiotrichaceae bacterium]PCI13262.1 MAG: TIGR00153 family protein [Thiotrichales bacterium]